MKSTLGTRFERRLPTPQRSFASARSNAGPCPNSAIDAAQRRLQTLYFESTRNIVDKLDPRPYFEVYQNDGATRTVKKKAVLDALSALSQETRLDLFRLLVTVGPEGLPAGVIAERLGVLPSSLTFHLNHLVRADLITQRRLSRQLIYSAEYGTMNDLLAVSYTHLTLPTKA